VEIFASEPSVPYSAPHEEGTISIHPSSEDLEIKNRPNEDCFSLVDAEKERSFRRTDPTAS
jgi:hypothetical protein